MYIEEEVSRLLDIQRGNCYVAVLTKCRDEEIATAAILAPEPSGGEWKKDKFDLTLYSQIENAIMHWNFDATRTAGSLTREIMGLIEIEKNNEGTQV